jgi:16S rRNA processing protein RimM
VSDFDQRDRQLVPLGYIAGVYGVKGWVKIHSWTRPRESILAYQPWLLGEDLKPVKIKEGRPQGKTIVVSLPEIDNREQAQKLVGLKVETKDGVELGHITKMMETGAHDVMIVSPGNPGQGEKERLIPFVPGHYVLAVDREAGKLVADWEPDYLA